MSASNGLESHVDDLRTRGWCVIPDIISEPALSDVRERVSASIIENSRSPAPRSGVRCGLPKAPGSRPGWSPNPTPGT